MPHDSPQKTPPTTNLDALRQLPAVETVLQDARLTAVRATAPPSLLTAVAQEIIAAARSALRDGRMAVADRADLQTAIVDQAIHRLTELCRPSYHRVINAMGIILHTGLGRAVLPRRAIDRITSALSGYSRLQVDLETGARDKRDRRIEWLLRHITHAEAATVVNNNAAATSFVLNTVAAGREVIVSRGQLVEIGGSFRLPDVMAASGVRLVEVGTTNKTHPRDYERAITDQTAAILRVHPSNYRISGFTAEVPLDTLVEIAHRHHLTMIDDVGAGPLVDVSQFGFEREPTLRESIGAGADLVVCSADKLIGASQGGIILGRGSLVQAVRKNPMIRILRPGKLTLAALEATLELFLDETTALREVPTLRMLARPLVEVAQQAERIAAALRDRIGAADVSVRDGFSQMGSGSLPTQDLPTRVVAVAPRGTSPERLARELRLHDPPVFVRVKDPHVLLDPRTLLDGEEEDLIRAMVETLARGEALGDRDGRDAP